MKDFILWMYWYPFRKCVQTLPTPLVRILAQVLGKLLYLCSTRKRHAYINEYRRLFSAAVEQQAEQTVVKGAFHNVACNELEMLMYPKLSRKNIADFVEIEGTENLDAALAHRNGVMLVFGHFGSNQMIMPAIGYNGYTMSQLSAPATVWQEVLKDRTFSPMEKRAAELRWEHEKSLPVTHINVFGSLKKAFKCLRRNEILGIAIDGGGGVDIREVNFLGQKALFSAGAMDLASRTGCKVLPTFMLRQSKGGTRLIIEPAIELGNGERQEVIAALMQTLVQRLEDYVRRYPDHYIDFLTLRSTMAARGDRAFIMEREQ